VRSARRLAVTTYAYIVVNDLLKTENLKRLFPDLYRSNPVFVTVTAAASGN
jgi:peptide-methionine (S)-S-oxide reductase